MRVFRQQYKDRTGKTRESAKWYVEVKDHLDVVRRMPDFTDKALTAELGRRIQKLVAVRVLGDILPPDLAAWVERLPQDIRDRLAQTGMVDPQTVASSNTLAAHLADFEANLRHRGRTEDHVKLVTTRCRRIVDECGFRFIGDISASRVQRFLAGIKDGGAAQQTVNHYVRAIKQFGGWLVKDRRTTESRLHDIETGNVKAAGVKCERRELNDDEILRLLDAARTGQSSFGLSGRQRCALYATALTTGLRASELASMTPAHFDFDSETPTVSIQASDEKARRGATLPIPAGLVTMLRDYIATDCEHDSTPLYGPASGQSRNAGASSFVTTSIMPANAG